MAEVLIRRTGTGMQKYTRNAVAKVDVAILISKSAKYSNVFGQN